MVASICNLPHGGSSWVLWGSGGVRAPLGGSGGSKGVFGGVLTGTLEKVSFPFCWTVNLSMV